MFRQSFKCTRTGWRALSCTRTSTSSRQSGRSLTGCCGTLSAASLSIDSGALAALRDTSKAPSSTPARPNTASSPPKPIRVEGSTSTSIPADVASSSESVSIANLSPRSASMSE
eukprot:6341258-Prymnesium_polylepis.2